MRRIFLHIGLPKTATTSLQAMLWNQRSFLMSKGVLYPASCAWGDKSHHKLFFALSGYKDRTHAHSWNNISAALIQEIRECHPNDMIISTELLSNYPRPEAIEKLLNLLGDSENDFYLLIGLRSLGGLYISNYFQRIRDPQIALSQSLGTWIAEGKVLCELGNALKWHDICSRVLRRKVYSRYEVQSAKNPVPFAHYFKQKYSIPELNVPHENTSLFLPEIMLLRKINSITSLSDDASQYLRSNSSKLILQHKTANPSLLSNIQSQFIGLGVSSSKLIRDQLKGSRQTTDLMGFLLNKKDYRRVTKAVVADIDFDELFLSVEDELGKLICSAIDQRY